jgi:hypothetical protein
MGFMQQTIQKTIPKDLVLSEEVIYQNGCFRRVRYYLRGWIYFGINSHWVYGYTGKETWIDWEEITPKEIIP